MILITISILLSSWAHCAAGEASVAWSDDFTTALHEAHSHNKQVLLVVANTTLTQGSRLLLKNVFSDPNLVSWIDQNATPVLLDFGQLSSTDQLRQARYRRVLQNLQVHEIPSILLLDDRGREIQRFENYVGGPLALCTQLAMTLGQDGVLRQLATRAYQPGNTDSQR